MDTLIMIKSRIDVGTRVEEGLRLAAAMIGMDHIPRIVFIDDGVECLLHGNSGGVILDYLSTISSLIGIHVLSESMIERGLKLEDLDLKPSPIDTEQLVEMMIECKIIIAF
ncbi:DsrE family protein [Candidatus Bathyarchaeota archaeon]|nr:DsrE family protein [Candidatus Bathyarchaeota archaeon]MBS7630844.1 DsrE family protein [Candidatus Bathyarchaeota archaeon]